MSVEFEEKIKKIKIVITDVDGVLTDGGMYYNDEGECMKNSIQKTVWVWSYY